MILTPFDRGEIALTRDGKPVAAILRPPGATSFAAWVAGEIRRYVERISGAALPFIATVGEAASGTPVIVPGGPTANPVAAMAENAGLADFRSLRRDGYVLRTLVLDGRPVVLAGGNGDAAAMYAAYDLVERLGVSFTLTADVVPERRPTLAIGPLDARCEPAVSNRGLHMRHFVMPWMGLAEFRDLAAQMAKLRMNYLEFYAYAGSPWVEYAWRGERKLVGDIYAPASGYTAWRSEVVDFVGADAVVGRAHFPAATDGEPWRPCAEEFRRARTPDEAHTIARDLLREMIRAAHERKIAVWLGKGDCPSVPPNFGRHASQGQWSPFFGRLLSPGDPMAVEIWTAAMRALIETYPEADGAWLWLSEGYLPDDDATRALVARYGDIRPLIPGIDALRAMGYDQYLHDLDEERVVVSDLGLVHCAKEIVGALRRDNPDTQVGVSVLGRSYLFRALDAALPPGVALQSMESAVCWNRGSRVPMENFAVPGREMFLVPRLDDDASELAMQFNAGLYDHDRVVSAGAEFGLAGIAPQTGRTRGVEHNARFVAEGTWDPALAPERFYGKLAARTFGEKSAPVMTRAFALLEEAEHYLGLGVDASCAGHCFQGIGNFLNYADGYDGRFLRRFRGQRMPYDGPDFPDWNAGSDEESPLLARLRYRDERFAGGIDILGRALDALRVAESAVAPGAAGEWRYLAMKTETYVLHLRAIRALAAGHFAYDAAFRARRAGDGDGFARLLDDALARYGEGYALAERSAEGLAAGIDHPVERLTLWRQNVRFLLPVREFLVFARNVRAFHRGEAYWEPVRWEIVDPPLPFHG